jgi:hypothetical protein
MYLLKDGMLKNTGKKKATTETAVKVTISEKEQEGCVLLCGQRLSF